jgi:hypothetical protein
MARITTARMRTERGARLHKEDTPIAAITANGAYKKATHRPGRRTLNPNNERPNTITNSTVAAPRWV